MICSMKEKLLFVIRKPLRSTELKQKFEQNSGTQMIVKLAIIKIMLLVIYIVALFFICKWEILSLNIVDNKFNTNLFSYSSIYIYIYILGLRNIYGDDGNKERFGHLEKQMHQQSFELVMWHWTVGLFKRMTDHSFVVGDDNW